MLLRSDWSLFACGALVALFGSACIPSRVRAGHEPGSTWWVADEQSDSPHPEKNSSKPEQGPGNDAKPTSCWQGEITYYSDKLAGRSTASGEAYDPAKLTAAHRTLPFGTLLQVQNGDHSVIVRVNDRGPFSGHATLDISRQAATQIGMVRAGRVVATICQLQPNAYTQQEPMNDSEVANHDVAFFRF